MANVAAGISSTVSAGLTVGGLANVAGNLTVGQNVAIGGTLTVNGKPITGSGSLPVVIAPLHWTVMGNTDQSVFAVPSSNAPALVSRNGLIEVPQLHYTTANGTLTFTNPCFGGETIYAYWTNP